MNIIIPVLIAIVTGVNISGFFAMAARTPLYTVFLGDIHYPLDYLDYLSYITQGKWHWLRSFHLFTGETTHLEFLNWPYVLFGRLGSFVGLQPWIIYQVMVVLGTVAFLLVAYQLIRLILPKRPRAQLLLFILLFLISNEFPNIYQSNGHWVFAYFYPFENWGEPFIRLSSVPHLIIIQTAVMVSFVVSFHYWQKKISLARAAIYAFATALVLASLQPLQWAFACGIIGLTSLYFWWKTKKIDALMPPVLLGFGGLIPALYLKHLFAYQPYSNTIAWESMQQTFISFQSFVTLQGPLMIIAIIGIFFIIPSLTEVSLTLIGMTVITIAIFFSPLPVALHIMNMRFFSVIPTLTFAYISTEFLYKLAKRIDPVHKDAFAWFAALLIIAITIPVTVKQVIQRTNIATPDNIMAYLPLGAYQAFMVAQKTVTPTETVLVEPLFAQPFAAVAGRHVFVSNELATVDYSKKNTQTTDFFYKSQPAEQKTAWLHQNHIAYIFTYAWQPLYLPNLQIIYQNQYAIFYKVK